MRKTELVDSVIQVTALDKRTANDVVDSVIEQITNALARGEPVVLTGFGSFRLKYAPARQGRNPKTGEALHIAARNTAQFKPGTKLTQAVQRDHTY